MALADDSVADHFDAQVEAGRRPEQFARIWVHTHPGDCPKPSFTDEETFARVFGRSDWAVMFILARGGQTYTRLRFNTGPGADMLIPVEVDFTQPFLATDFEAWEVEYLASVHVQPSVTPGTLRRARGVPMVHDEEVADEWYDIWEEYIEDDERQEGAEL